MFRLVLLSIFISFSATASTGDSCDSTVDLREFGKSLEGLESVAQGYEKTNLCGFVTFSQFLDSYRISRKGMRGSDLVRSSGISIGVENAIRVGLPFWFPIQNSTDPLALRLGRWGSTFCSLANAVKKSGYCADPLLPTMNADETAKFADITTFVYDRLLKIAQTSNRNRGSAILLQLDGIYGNYDGIYERYLEWAFQGKVPVLSRSAILDLIISNPTRPYEVIQSIFLPNCRQARTREMNLTFETCESESFLDLDVSRRIVRASKKIHALLDLEKPLPIPFAYCSSVLTQGKKYDRVSPIGKGCGIHWSLISGRKKILGECHLLVRNSWKYEGKKYSPDWIVEGGDIWVREKELMRSMLLAQWLKE